MIIFYHKVAAIAIHKTHITNQAVLSLLYIHILDIDKFVFYCE